VRPRRLAGVVARPLNFTVRRLVRRIAKPLLLAALLPVSDCSDMRGGPDDMCTEIATFANSATDGAVHKVQLVNEWGARPTQQDGVETLPLQRCEHDDSYEPGKALCGYLVEHTSFEFQAINVRRALACLRTPQARPYLAQHATYASLEVYSRTAMHLKAPTLCRSGILRRPRQHDYLGTKAMIVAPPNNRWRGP
jgi:hypothetical protein